LISTLSTESGTTDDRGHRHQGAEVLPVDLDRLVDDLADAERS